MTWELGDWLPEPSTLRKLLPGVSMLGRIKASNRPQKGQFRTLKIDIEVPG
jgi:hypothetical protein